MWAYRWILRISWIQKATNKVMRRNDRKRKLWDNIRWRKVAYLIHLFWHDVYTYFEYGFLQLIMMGKVAGKRHVGRRTTSLLRNLREWTRVASAVQLFCLARVRRIYKICGADYQPSLVVEVINEVSVKINIVILISWLQQHSKIHFYILRLINVDVLTQKYTVSLYKKIQRRCIVCLFHVFRLS